MVKTVISLLLTLICTSVSNAQWKDQTPPDEVPVYLPTDYDPKVSSPLVIFLHGWAPISPIWYDILVPIQDDANEHGYIFAKPVGSQDGLGDYYWNATDACCDIFNSNPDHVGYIRAVVDSIKENYNVDPQRIHLIGQSNGGFMCHRMACEAPDMFASIVSLSGVIWNDETNCQPSEPIHILSIHGTLDPIVFWLGGLLGPELVPYPSATSTAAYWATHNGCSTDATNAGNFNFDDFIWFPDAETTRWVYEQCEDSSAGSSELWEVFGGSHFPIISTEGTNMIFEYMDTHTKPVPTCNADVNGDDQVNVADVLYVIGAWKSSDPDADINNDGVVNVADLLEVISGWGPC